MTVSELEILDALNTKVHLSRLTKSARFIEGLVAKKDPKAYTLNATKRLWLFSLLCRYRKSIPDVHEKHCQNPNCRKVVEVKKRAVQLMLF